MPQSFLSFILSISLTISLLITFCNFNAHHKHSFVNYLPCHFQEIWVNWLYIRLPEVGFTHNLCNSLYIYFWHFNNIRQFSCFCTNWSTRSWVQPMIYNSQISYHKCLLLVMFLITCLYLCFVHVSLLRKSWSTIRCLTATLWCYAIGHISQPGLFSISIRRLLVRSREVLKPWDW